MKKIQLITKILAVALIVAIAFVGIYLQKQNRMENVIKDYTWGMDLTGARVIELTVSEEKETITRDKDGKIVKEEDKKEDGDYTTEEKPVNADEVKTADNYKKSKQILEKRLEKYGVNDYIIKLDEDSGKIIIEIPENDQSDHIVSNISQVGKFEIVDSQDTEKVLMDNNDIKLSNVMYNTTMSGTTVYLNIEFNKEGTDKLKNISAEYKKSEETTSDEATEENEDGENSETEAAADTETENKEDKEKTNKKEITMQIDGSKMITTSFDETMENGVIQLTMGQATKDKEKLSEYMQNAGTMATVLDTGNMPVEYEIENNQYTASDITKDMLTKLAIVEAVVALCAVIVLIIKHKKLGLLATIAYIGFIAVYLLLIRYTNVTITLEGIAAIAVIFTLNFVFSFKLLNNINKYSEEKNKAIKETFKSFTIKTIPIWILSIVFCFMSWMPISSFGMVMFWGLILIELYNLVVTRSFIKE